MRIADILSHLERATPCVWVVVAGVRGSAPREEGAGMLITAGGFTGTIGGGHLEQKALELAREWLRLGKTEATRRHYPLGPALGQCCGGAVDLLFRPVTKAERDWVETLARLEQAGGMATLTTRLDVAAPHTVCLVDDAPIGAGSVTTRHVFAPWPIWIFGAGHVGKALVQVLSTLPCTISWVDSRADELDAAVVHNAQHDVGLVHSDYPADEVDDIPAGADVLVLTHNHALDLEIVAALLRRTDLGCIGMIGSETKAALFRRRLAERGLDAGRLVCPIGVSAAGSKNKHPGAIAVSVAADLLARRAVQANVPSAARTARHPMVQHG